MIQYGNIVSLQLASGKMIKFAVRTNFPPPRSLYVLGHNFSPSIRTRRNASWRPLAVTLFRVLSACSVRVCVSKEGTKVFFAADKGTKFGQARGGRKKFCLDFFFIAFFYPLAVSSFAFDVCVSPQFNINARQAGSNRR